MNLTCENVLKCEEQKEQINAKNMERVEKASMKGMYHGGGAISE